MKQSKTFKIGNDQFARVEWEQVELNGQQLWAVSVIGFDGDGDWVQSKNYLELVQSV